MQPTSQVRYLPWWEEFVLLLRVQFTDYRGNASYLVIFGLLMPLGFFWLLQTWVGLGAQTIWLLAGNLILAISFGSVNFAIQRTAWVKLSGEIDYYGTLPIRRGPFVAGLFTLSLLSTMPGMIANLFLGYFALDLPLSALLSALPISLLAGGVLTIVGAAVGALAKSMSQLSLYFYISYAVVTFLCPVLIPMERLPFVLRLTAYALPPGEAALALTDALNGRFGGHFWALVGALLLWFILACAVGLRRLSWRRD